MEKLSVDVSYGEGKNGRKLKVKTEKPRKNVFLSAPIIFLDFHLETILMNTAGYEKSRDKGYPLLFFLLLSLTFFSRVGGKIVKSISPIVPFITTRKHLKGNANWDIFGMEMEKKEIPERLESQKKNIFITRVRACWRNLWRRGSGSALRLWNEKFIKIRIFCAMDNEIIASYGLLWWRVKC